MTPIGQSDDLAGDNGHCLQPVSQLRGFEFQGGSIDTVAEACGLGSVFEDMTQMAIATGAVNLGPGDEHLKIGACSNYQWTDRLPEARPASVAVIFVL